MIAATEETLMMRPQRVRIIGISSGWQLVALQRTQQMLQFAIALGDLSGIGVDQGQGCVAGVEKQLALGRYPDISLTAYSGERDRSRCCAL